MPNYSTVGIWSIIFLLTSICFWFMGDILINGWGGINLEFLLTTPQNAGREGGIASIIISTGLILLICIGVSLPLGLATAITLSEISSKNIFLKSMIRKSLDVLAGMPSIVFGLFGNIFFCNILGFGFSIISGGLTLSCMVLPLLIRSIEEGLHFVPLDQKIGAQALGLSRFSLLRNILLPLSAPYIVAGLILGIGRAVAETAALIFTSGYVDRYPESLFDSGRSLSIHIYDLSMNVAGGNKNAYASALVLLIFILFMNQMASFIGTYYLQKNLSKEGILLGS